jgi:hypothetical protein
MTDDVAKGHDAKFAGIVSQPSLPELSPQSAQRPQRNIFKFPLKESSVFSVPSVVKPSLVGIPLKGSAKAWLKPDTTIAIL